jgi:predicted phage terminase large subunit-like protein
MFKIRQIPVPEPGYPVEDFGGHLEQSYSMESEGKIDYCPVGVKNCVRFWDLAATEKKQGTDPDYTSGTLLGITKSGLVYILHNVTLRAAPQQVLTLIQQTASIDGPLVKIYIEQEGGASGKALISTWQRELVGYVMEGIPSTGDKQTRAWPFAAQVNLGQVRLVKGLWNGMWLANHRVFPHGKHDDIVDSTSGAFAQAAGGKIRRGGISMGGR